MKRSILCHGALRFTALEEGEGIPVVLLHGFPDHARTFRFQLPALADSGYHAIAPLMRGYEPSSQPRERDYQLSSLAADVMAFISDSGYPRVHLVGHDWGAVVSYLVAASAPEILLSLTTLAIPHPGRFLREAWHQRPGQLLNSWYIAFFQLRGLADFVLEWRDFAFMEWLWRRWSPGWQLPDLELAALKETFRQPGVKASALQYYRALFRLCSLGDSWATLQKLCAPIPVPTLALTGAHDRCMDTRLHYELMRPADFPAGLVIERIEGAGHFLQQEKPEAVNELLLRHLKAHDGREGETFPLNGRRPLPAQFLAEDS